VWDRFTPRLRCSLIKEAHQHVGHLQLEAVGYATGYNNARVDALLDQARQTFEQAERKKLYSEAQAIIAREVPMLPLFSPWVEYAALRDSVQGFAWIPDQIPRLRDLWKK
jgi:peptide/nickel transport system substrate-binding protein